MTPTASTETFHCKTYQNLSAGEIRIILADQGHKTKD